ncbi:MAG: nucleotidyltransferase domain-containing protein [Bacillota bacterium]|nr:nucleotidyltransferase domain-containing protein [Bacillota bacterium]
MPNVWAVMKMVLEDARQILEQYKEKLGERLLVEALILLGSRARGDNAADSDFDVAVVSEAFRRLSPYERRILLLETWSFHHPVDVHGFTPDELLALDRPLLWEAVHDGIAVVDTGVFARAQRRLCDMMSSGELERLPGGWRRGRAPGAP